MNKQILCGYGIRRYCPHTDKATKAITDVVALMTGVRDFLPIEVCMNCIDNHIEGLQKFVDAMRLNESLATMQTSDETGARAPEDGIDVQRSDVTEDIE